LRRLGPVLDAIGSYQVHAVAMSAHHVAGNVIGDDPVGSFRVSLRHCLLNHIFGFRREADEQPRAPIACTELGEDIARRCELELRWACTLLELGWRWFNS